MALSSRWRVRWDWSLSLCLEPVWGTFMGLSPPTPSPQANVDGAGCIFLPSNPHFSNQLTTSPSLHHPHHPPAQVCMYTHTHTHTLTHTHDAVCMERGLILDNSRGYTRYFSTGKSYIDSNIFWEVKQDAEGFSS